MNRTPEAGFAQPDSQMEGGQGAGMGSAHMPMTGQNAGNQDQNYSMSSERVDAQRKRKKPSGGSGMDSRNESDLAQPPATFEIEEFQQ